MSNQDMQFADPEWVPPEEREATAGQREQQTLPPQPFNADQREQSQWQTMPPPQQGYLGPGYAGSQPQMTWNRSAGSRPYRSYGRRNLWFWIILAFIIIALMSGGLSRGFGNRGFGFGPPPDSAQPQPLSYNVSAAPTIVINGGGGDITVETGGPDNQVIITSGFGGNTVNQKGNTITVTEGQDSNFGPGNGNLDVVVPPNFNSILEITTTDGSIGVNGVNGQMTLNSKDGDITANNDVLTGPSTLSSQSGDVTFSGSIGSGNYQFQSSSGSVDVTLPSNSNFHVDAYASSNPDSDSINSEFPNVHIQNNTTSSEAHGDVGNASQAQLMLKTDSGDISLHQS